jgi:folate-dependent phosphoribosylglycinamide formyltransferase PurN
MFQASGDGIAVKAMIRASEAAAMLDAGITGVVMMKETATVAAVGMEEVVTTGVAGDEEPNRRQDYFI